MERKGREREEKLERERAQSRSKWAKPPPPPSDSEAEHTDAPPPPLAAAAAPKYLRPTPSHIPSTPNPYIAISRPRMTLPCIRTKIHSKWNNTE